VTHLATGIRISSYDVPIAVPITPSLPISAFPAPLSPLTDDITGFAFNIYNNIWETNYIVWYPYLLPDDSNFKARFRIDFSGVKYEHSPGRKAFNVNPRQFNRL
jgi:hypothetical protein